MSRTKFLVAVAVAGSVGLAASVVRGRISRPERAAAVAAPSKCKPHNGKGCCDPAMAAHLPLAAVLAACGESDATYLGEEGTSETCRYYFTVPGAKEDETWVQIYSPPVKEPPNEPNQMFVSYEKVGNVFVTDKLKDPMFAGTLEKSTGLWYRGTGYPVSIAASTKVCDRAQAKKLAPSIN